MDFQNDKKHALEKIAKFDKSKKGSVDKEIASLIKLINAHSDFYTTSSCAGRIMLFRETVGKKNESGWLFISHSQVKMKELLPYLSNLPKETLWLRMEAPILHICAKDMDAADKLLKIANDSGFRRTSILSFKKRIIIEIFIPEKMDTPISENKKLLVKEDYLKTLIRHANSRLKKSRNKLKKFEKLFSLFLKQHN